MSVSQNPPASEATLSSSSTTSTATGTAESASVTVGGPSFGYTGPTDISVYYDTIYKSFLFVPLTGLPARRGILRSLSGVPLANEEIVVTAGNRKVRTFTDARGEYRIFEALPGALEVQVRGTRKRFAGANERLDVSVP